MISSALRQILVFGGDWEGIMMKARRTGLHAQAKPKVQRVVTIILAALSAMLSVARAETPVERGGYLVKAVMACDGCHTPRAPGGALDMSKRFAGGSQTWDTPRYLVKGANISPDPETGIGKWSADDFKRALTEGVRPSGVALAPQMPFVFYKVLTPSDLDAVTAYVRSVTPVRNEVQPPVYRAPSHPELIPGAEKPMSEEELRDPGFNRGFYLATIAHCMECHARRPDGTQDYVRLMGQGRIRIQRCLGSFESLQHHLASNQRHRRLDRCRDQAGTCQRSRPRRPHLQAADGAPHLLQQND
jgi:cytochrome c553